jgi:hypothetical protein
MSKIHKKSGYACMVCEEKSENNIVFHKTRRQTHSLCLDCAIGYLTPIISQSTDNVRNNIRRGSDMIKCPGSVTGHTRNQCKHMININTINIPQCELSLDLFRLIYVLKTDNTYLCPVSKCGGVVEVDPDYIGNNLICHGGCNSSWCRNCLISPFHVGKSCIEVEAESKNTENGKMIWELKNKGKLKFCPCCKAPCIKNNGCNKMLCTVCNSKWCWLCKEIDIEYDHYNTSITGGCTGKLWEGVDENGNALPEEVQEENEEEVQAEIKEEEEEEEEEDNILQGDAVIQYIPVNYILYGNDQIFPGNFVFPYPHPVLRDIPYPAYPLHLPNMD